MPPTLPPLPPASHLTAAFGTALAAPADWNPTLLHATRAPLLRRLRIPDPAATGVVLLSDLRAARMEVRWRTFPSPDRAGAALQRTLARLAAARTKTRHHRGLHHLTERHEFLTAIADRFYELRFPAGPPQDALLDWFLHTNTLLASHTQRLWSLYGAHGWAPRHAAVRKLLLQPGHTEILLATPDVRTTLGSFALADRLLANTTILGWAKSQPWTNGVTGQWAVDGPSLHFTGTELHRFCRRLHHDLTLHHDPAANRISWEHTRSRPR